MELKRQRRKSKKSKIKDSPSFLISFVIHITILIVLSLSISVPQTNPIVISFEASFETQSIDTESVDIELPAVQISDLATEANSPIDEPNSVLEIPIEYIDRIETTHQRLDQQFDIVNIGQPAPSSLIVSTNSNENSGNNEDGNSFGSYGEGKDEMSSRLMEVGAKTGDIQVSISWNNYNDIDVWVEYISFRNNSMAINWMQKNAYYGHLDIDMNLTPMTNRAVENIYFEKARAPFGLYNVYIQNYRQWEKTTNTTVVNVRIIVDGEVTYKTCRISTKDRLVKIFTFNRVQTKELVDKIQQRNQHETTYGQFGYAGDDIVIQPIPTFQ